MFKALVKSGVGLVGGVRQKCFESCSLISSIVPATLKSCFCPCWLSSKPFACKINSKGLITFEA